LGRSAAAAIASINSDLFTLIPFKDKLYVSRFVALEQNQVY
jgi:hypothetical protein